MAERSEKRKEKTMEPFTHKSFLKLLDFTPAQIQALLDLAADLKAKKKAGIPHHLCQGKNIALLFEKASTRTRCAFEVAAFDLGMHCTYLDPQSSQMGKKESIADTARVLGRMYDGIEYRGFGQELVETLAKYDARFNMANSLMIGCAKMGMHFVACAPEKYFPEAELRHTAVGLAQENGATLEFLTDPLEATKNAHVIYTDVWVSMGEGDRVWEQRIQDLLPYRVTEALMKNAGPQCRFMHCLPAFHDLGTGIGQQMREKFGLTCMEVTDAVFESQQSIVFDEAENRMHTIKAVMAATLI